ncbi:magnesium-protoporphyrin IX monomethyl ester anaerobic oxidative cyclase [Bradyrhizobium sp. AUGA SZCCT0169]|uniref:magnesium-protoporphyrin IX monomethyl ester anaerobic oxidative cyclase n=1 Tax=Bradyrhizobium sp. AUGA SZCCT0169 TaxID=2807663 RepID=UPI001BADD53A|nr:magnesium-protoporphyrin IX monomethyl ester anaerobic oxidative cyclase [Bradyrhizobium sp. AUGA SZCCT0169]MBR1250402.1 magnesium-protoporphyrin IX monomethyl ester anaerobic oxidative cyclase [Bradyrhizobium sp. AUGA SZCCT0169]
MRILLVNVPHPSIGSRIPDDHLPPLGLLSIGGPLIDDGHEVRLLDGEFGPMLEQAITAEALTFAPDAVLFGHSGSTSGHPVITEIAQAIVRAMPNVLIVYGGVFPTYHWREVLRDEPYVTAIVRGEGEETARRLMRALEYGHDLGTIAGIAFRDGNDISATQPAPVIRDLDAYRVGWELIDHARYSYWGGLRAVVVQFSRGCPHLCNYCGQRGFWTRWRHRDPVRFAKELARLHREHGVKVINFADENPTVSKKAWRAFLEALIAENVDLILVGSTRADDIVRDADILHLYKKAGWQRFLLGMENTDEKTLELIRKGATTTTDREAIRLMRQHGILSMATWVVGFEEETDRDHWRGLRQLLSYDPDQIQMLYVTPHRWTPYFRLAADRRVIQTDRRRWDYKHQVLATRNMAPWRVLLWFKFTEMMLQCRPKAILRVLFHRDAGLRHAMRWYTQMGRRVWPHEIWGFLLDIRLKDGPTVSEFWGAAQDGEEESMSAARPERRVGARKAA